MFQDFRYSDTTHLSRSVEVLKLKKFQERCNIKAFQEWYEHVGPEVASPQDGKVTRWRRDCAWLMISRCSRSQCQIQVQGTSSIQEVNDHYNIFTRESQEYELKTKDKAYQLINLIYTLTYQSLSQHHVSPYQSSQFVTPYQTQQFTTNQSTPLSITYPTNEYQSTVHHNVYSQQPSIPQLEYAPTTYQQQQPEFSQPDSSLVVPVFQKGDDPIDAINHMMSFLTAICNPVTVQPVQGRQTTYAAGTTRKYTPGASGSNTGKQRTVICYNCKGEGHIAKQCPHLQPSPPKPKRKKWLKHGFNDKCCWFKLMYGGQALTRGKK
ncbi:integrase, catalytic region, zinc finger, CCHC-type containing protein [Tanacetum coccineum]